MRQAGDGILQFFDETVQFANCNDKWYYINMNNERSQQEGGWSGPKQMKGMKSWMLLDRGFYAYA